MTDICNGVPMSIMQLRDYLQDSTGVPVVLKEEGTDVVRCPYCNELHFVDAESGLHVADCSEDIRSEIGIVIGERSFIPNYGFVVYSYRISHEVNELITDT